MIASILLYQIVTLRTFKQIGGLFEEAKQKPVLKNNLGLLGGHQHGF